MNSRLIIAISLFSLLVLSSCGGGSSGSSEDSLELPDGFPSVSQPSDNEFSENKFQLGRHLFYDKKMSLNQTFSCSSCHNQDKAFTDGRRTSIGSTGETHPRNAPSIANVGYMLTLNWANPVIRTLEDQALVPIFGQHPLELGFSGRENELLDRFKSSPLYTEMFASSFPNQSNPITIDNVLKALGTFQRSIISGNSNYDKYVYQGDKGALSESALRGLQLFFSERLECDHCHSSFNFSAPANHEGVSEVKAQFENNGLYNIRGTGDYPTDNTGLFEFTQEPSDMGKFRPPTLRNIELSAPYMHDGSIATLEEVVEHYARGGRKIESGSFAGDGRLSPYKSGLIAGFQITEQEKADLVEFLKSLTDWEFIYNERYSDPFIE